MKQDPCFAELYTSPRAKLVTAEELIDSMDEQGVDVSVALNIGWVSHELCVRSNDYILEAISRYPGRLIGFCTVQPRAGEKALAELERCIKAGIKGIGELRPDTQGADLANTELWRPLAEMAEKHHLLLLLHSSEPVGHQYPGKGSITPDKLYRFICEFPQLQVIGAHWGGGLPFYALMPEVASALLNTYFDTAASPLLYRSQIFKHVIELAGAEKILFGSDYPLIPSGRLIKEISSLDLAPEVQSMILGGNAQQLLKIGGAPPVQR